MRLFLLTSTHRNKLKMRVLERNASDGVNPIILIQFGSLYLTRLIRHSRGRGGDTGMRTRTRSLRFWYQAGGTAHAQCH